MQGMGVALIIAACFAAALAGGMVVAFLATPGRTVGPVATTERAAAWAEVAKFAALHYGGTTEHPGPEAGFPRERIPWRVLADGTLYAPNVRIEGGTLRPSQDLRVGFWTAAEGGSLTMLTGAGDVTFGSEVLSGGASSVWLNDIRFAPPPVRA